MPQTPLTGSVPYASSADLRLFKDRRQVDQLAGDTGLGQPFEAVLTQVLAAASGRVEEYVLTGGRYAPADLAALTGNARARLKELVCELAFFRLAKRRWPTAQDRELADVLESLDRLAAGVTIFGTVEAVAATLPAVTTLDPGDDRRTVRKASRYFGSRGER